jgi:hypothetical protein
MNDFSDIENELRALRPVQPSSAIFESVSRELDQANATVEPASTVVVRPDRFRPGWLSLGLGLAAAAAVLILVRVDFRTSLRRAPAVAAMTPNPAIVAVPLTSAQFIPAGATRVVYHTQDEGLLFPQGSTEPVRRVRSRSRETLQWHNPGTGESLRVSYPSEEVRFIPVAGQ